MTITFTGDCINHFLCPFKFTVSEQCHTTEAREFLEHP